MIWKSANEEKILATLADLFSSEKITTDSIDHVLRPQELENIENPYIQKVYLEKKLNHETREIEDNTDGPYVYSLSSVNLALAALYAIQQQNLLLSQIQTSLAALTAWRSGILAKLKKLFPLVNWDSE